MTDDKEKAITDDDDIHLVFLLHISSLLHEKFHFDNVRALLTSDDDISAFEVKY